MAIRPDKDPLSAAPHSGLDTGDLEKYGVWVKAEPRDIIDGNGSPASEEVDFDLPAEASPIAEESFLSEDEERLLGTFDADFDSGSHADSSSSDLGPLPDIEDSNRESDVFGKLDMSLEELGSPAAAIHPDAEIDMANVSGLESTDFDLASDSRPPSDSMEDVSAEFLDDLDMGSAPSIPSGPASSQFEAGGADSQFLPEAEDAIPLSHPLDASQDFEPLDIDLHFEGDSSSPRERAPEPASDFDDFISPSDAKSRQGGFDDIAAVTASLSDGESGGLEGNRRGGSPDLSSELLVKIADELRNIRGELVSLKSQIAGIASSESEPKSESQAVQADSSGFYSKEEDETIALTGDELDNILNTADFTEEAVETTAESLLEESLLPESGIYETDRSTSPAIEEIRLGEADSVDEIEEAPADDSLTDLVSFAEEGVHAMTSAPEDSSYLEGGDISLDEGMSFEGAPLEDVPLVEPDLSEFEIESDESPLEVSEELPVAPEQQDLKLDIDAGPGYGQDYQADEAEFLEPVPELDESGFGEINLHEESKERRSEPLAESGIDDLEEVEELEELIESGDDTGISGSEPISVLPDEVPIGRDESIDLDAEALSSTVESTPVTEDRPAEAPVSLQASEEDDRLKTEIRSVLSYLDKLLDSLPEDKIEEFARSEYFDTYKRLFEELGLV